MTSIVFGLRLYAIMYTPYISRHLARLALSGKSLASIKVETIDIIGVCALAASVHSWCDLILGIWK